LLRKGAIAIAGLMFRANPGFQLASILLVLFACYVVQVQNQPYMSTAQRQMVLAEHRAKALAGDELHEMVEARIKTVLEGDQKTRVGRGRNVGGKSSFSDLTKQHKDQKKKRKKDAKMREYFFDYNTVEQVLLACAIFVCVAGVMFESDRFANDITGRYDWQRKIIVYGVMTVVIFSLVYYLCVFSSEVGAFTPETLKKCFASKDKMASELIEDAVDIHNVEMTAVNPMQLKGLQEDEIAALKHENEIATKKAEEMNDMNLRLMEKMRVDLASNRGRGGGLSVKSRKKKRHKKDFGATKTRLGREPSVGV